MKRTKTSGGKIAMSSHTKSEFVFQVPEGEDTITNVSGTYVLQNRWDVEAQKSLLILGSQATSDIAIGDDLGSESFRSRTSASQTAVDKFQETRILSFGEIKHRTLDAIKRAEQKRKELIQQEADLESDF
jgi:hypothetical protein